LACVLEGKVTIELKLGNPDHLLLSNRLRGSRSLPALCDIVYFCPTAIPGRWRPLHASDQSLRRRLENQARVKCSLVVTVFLQKQPGRLHSESLLVPLSNLGQEYFTVRECLIRLRRGRKTRRPSPFLACPIIKKIGAHYPNATLP
jgi:hypothetical protein